MLLLCGDIFKAIDNDTLITGNHDHSTKFPPVNIFKMAVNFQ